MLSLETPTSFIAKRKASSFLGVDDNPESSYVVATFSTLIALVQVDDNKVVRSWSCTRGRRNTSAVIFAPYENEFVVIQNENVLRTFSEDSPDFGDSFTLNHKAHSLVRCHGHNPLVLLENGSLHRLRDVLENPKGIVQQKIEGMELKEILFTCSFVPSTGDIVVYSICRVDKGYVLLTSKVPKDDGPISHQHSEVNYKSSVLKAASAYSRGNTAKIVTIWDNGSVCLLNQQLQHDGQMGVRIEKVASLEIDGSAAVTSLSEYQAAVLGKDSVAILDLKYGTVHCKTCIENQNEAKMFTMRNYVLLDMPGQLRKLRFSVAPVTLSSVLMKREPHEANRGQICAKWSDSSTQENLLSSKESTLVKTLIESKDESIFDKIWTQFWKGKSQHFKQQFCLSASMHNILSRFQATKEKMDFWPRSGLLKIVATDLINGRWCEGMMQHALEDQDWVFLSECFKHLNNISEEMMVSSISCAMKSRTPHMENGSGEQMEDLESLPTSCINQVLQLSYSENVLRKDLASLPFDIVLGLIEHLTTLLEGLSLFSTDLTVEQVISWLSMLLDAHLSEIMVLEDSWPAIHRLCEATRLQGLVFEELSQVDSVLIEIQSKLVKAKRPKHTLYSIEVLKIW